MQTIVNMSHNGVKDAVFGDLLEAGPSAEIVPLTDWKGPHTGARLANAIVGAGGLVGAPLARLAGAEARVFNYIRFEDKYGDLEDSNDGDGDRQGVDRKAGCGWPSFIALRIHVRTSPAGFLPISTPIVCEGIKYIVNLVIETRSTYYRASAEMQVLPTGTPPWNRPFGMNLSAVH